MMPPSSWLISRRTLVIAFMEYNHRHHHHSFTSPAYFQQDHNMPSSSSRSWAPITTPIYHSINNFESNAIVPQLTVCPSDLIQPSSPYDFGPVYLGRLSEETRDLFQANFHSPHGIEPARESRLRGASTSTSLPEQHSSRASLSETNESSSGRRIPCLVGGCKTTFANTKNRDRHLKHIQHSASTSGVKEPQVLWHCAICKPPKKLTRRDGYRRHGLSVHLVKKWQEWSDEYCRKIQAMKHRDVTREREELEREREEKLMRRLGRRSI